MTSGLAALQAAAPLDSVDVHSVSDTSLIADVIVERSWATQRFQLEIHEKKGAISVREHVPTLPLFCPERHIVRNGYFCLGLDPSSPQNLEQAAAWWLSLLRYLELQMNADAAGTWPEKHAWRHGIAWAWQETLEVLIRQADPGFIESLEAGRIRLLDDDRLPTFWVRNGDLEGRVPKPLQRGRRDRQRHRNLMFKIGLVLVEMTKAEGQFWDLQKASGSVCCRTMTNCPLGRMENPPEC